MNFLGRRQGVASSEHKRGLSNEEGWKRVCYIAVMSKQDMNVSCGEVKYVVVEGDMGIRMRIGDTFLLGPRI